MFPSQEVRQVIMVIFLGQPNMCPMNGRAELGSVTADTISLAGHQMKPLCVLSHAGRQWTEDPGELGTWADAEAGG